MHPTVNVNPEAVEANFKNGVLVHYIAKSGGSQTQENRDFYITLIST